MTDDQQAREEAHWRQGIREDNAHIIRALTDINESLITNNLQAQVLMMQEQLMAYPPGSVNGVRKREREIDDLKKVIKRRLGL